MVSGLLWFQSTEVDELLKNLLKQEGVIGYVLINHDGNLKSLNGRNPHQVQSWDFAGSSVLCLDFWLGYENETDIEGHQP